MAEPAPTGAPAAEADRLMRLAGLASVAVAAALVVLKLAAWLLTDSVSLLSALVDSLVDVFASVVNMAAIWIALRPPDERHRFGHGKAESLAALAQAMILAATAGFLLVETVDRLLAPRPIRNEAVGIAVMVAAAALNAALLIYQRRVVRRTGSLAVEADSYHSRSHALVDLAVIVALGLTVAYGWVYFDALFGAAIAVYIGIGVWRILVIAVNILMDRELPGADQARIRAIVDAHPEVIGCTDLRTRTAGTRKFVQLRLSMAPELTLARAHAIAHEVEAEIRRALPSAEVIVHQEPAADAGVDKA